MIELIKQNSNNGQKALEIDPVEIYNEERYIIAKELMVPLDANKAVILTEQIIQKISSPMVDAPKPRIFNKWKKCRRNIISQKLSQKFEQPLPLG